MDVSLKDFKNLDLNIENLNHTKMKIMDFLEYQIIYKYTEDKKQDLLNITRILKALTNLEKRLM